jgi:DNA-binding MarR family transcriptional regulator
MGTRRDEVPHKAEGTLESGEDKTNVMILPFETSIGYQIRVTHRAIQRRLQSTIEPYEVTLGMWYFLRALWDEDGLTQRELSHRVGTMEPTTLTAIAAMERSGFVTRMRNTLDKRKINIHLTLAGKELERRLVPLAIDVLDLATRDFSAREKETLLTLLKAVQSNLESRDGNTEPPEPM